MIDDIIINVVRLFWIFIFATFVILGYIISSANFRFKELAFISPIPEVTQYVDLMLKPSLQEVVFDELMNAQGEYGVAVKDLASGKMFFYNEDVVFEAASLYKLWVMAESLRQLEGELIFQDTLLEEERTTLYKKFKLATESAGFVEEKISMTVKEALEQMIVVSDNDAALLLSAHVRLLNVSRFLKNEGFNKSTIGVPPKTTAKEITLFFEKIYNGELVSKDSSEKMLSILVDQRLNDRIPKYLPQGTKVAHKTGELGEFKHDAGIIYSPNKDYIIVLLSKTNDPKNASERIARISKAVYVFFNKN